MQRRNNIGVASRAFHCQNTNTWMQEQDPADLQNQVDTYLHVNLLNQKAKTRFADDEAQSTDERARNGTLRRLAECTKLSHARVRTLKLSSLVEQFEKTFQIKDPEGPVLCEVKFTWEIERNLLRRSTFDSHHAVLTVNGKVAMSVDDTCEFGDVASEPLSEYIDSMQQASSLTSFLTNEAASSLTNEASSLSNEAKHACTPTEALWFLSFLCSYPSDVAFDIVSKPLMDRGES